MNKSMTLNRNVNIKYSNFKNNQDSRFKPTYHMPKV